MSYDYLAENFDRPLHEETIDWIESAGIENGDVYLDKDIEKYRWRNADDEHWWNALNNRWYDADIKYEVLCDRFGPIRAKAIKKRVIEEGCYNCDIEDMPGALMQVFDEYMDKYVLDEICGHEGEAFTEEEIFEWLVDAICDDVLVNKDPKHEFIGNALDAVVKYAYAFIMPEPPISLCERAIPEIGNFILGRFYDNNADYYMETTGGAVQTLAEWREEYDDFAVEKEGTEECQTWEEWSKSLVQVVPNIPGTDGYDDCFGEWRDA